MKEITTKDSSVTFHSEEFDETYHSISGAREEAMKKFILPSLKNYELGDKVRILDVCFGLGYNSAAAIDELKKFDCKIEIIALENDEKILKKILDINTEFESYNKIKELIKNNYSYDDGKVKIKIILGDAVKEIKRLKEKFDFIFHDPFSRTKMPLFWTEEFFKEEYRLLKKEGILTTYSCARLVRDNLKKAKFKIEDVPPVGRRAPSTLARVV